MSQTFAIARDRNDWAGSKPGHMQYLNHATRRSGRSPLELAREYARLHFGRGKLTLEEYVQYGVYDLARHDASEQSRFVTNNLHWPITRSCCDMTCQSVTEDKWLCASILRQGGAPTPETLAVIDRGSRVYPGTRKISTADELRAFATAEGALPLFGKENRGTCSFGAFLISEADENRVRLEGEGWMDYAALVDEFIGSTPYILQPLVRNHSFFDRFTQSLATIRVCILLSDDVVKIPFAVLKLPSSGNVADSFWRPGNLACDLDLDTGRIVTARSKDALGTTDHTDHPETGETLIGATAPMWSRVLDTARACAPMFQSARYQSMDIAVSETGPVVIEVNTGGGFDLPQLASGRGFLTDEVTEFFRDCGYAKI